MSTSGTRPDQPRRYGESWDTFRPTRRFQGLWVALAVLFGLPGLAATYLRVTAPTQDGPALAASFIPFAVVAYGLATVFFLIALIRARRRGALAFLTVLTAALLSCHVGWLAPLFIADQRPARTPTFTVMSLNVYKGVVDADELSDQAQDADLVVLLEAVPGTVQQLDHRGWRQRFPYSVGEARGDFGDTLLYSRFPLSDSGQLSGSPFQQWIATAEVPEVGPVRVIAAHPCNPYCPSDQFRIDHEQLKDAATANMDLPLLIAGDLNATDDHAPIRALRRDGVRSVTDIVGAGWLPTWPANYRIPPLVPIDHILVNPLLTATSVHTLHIGGTDHLGLKAQIAGS